MSRLIFCIICICNVVFVKTIVVETTLGKVRGKLVHDDTVNVSYCEFTGIPYAEPPVGSLRWQPPISKTPWDDVFNATKPGCVCPQTELYYSRAEMDEDCLNFNIYTPANALNKSLPVLFVIHGGGFDSQSGNAEPIYGPQLLMQDDIVIVTMNYRLGALGFLSLCTEEISGNAGVKDVLLLLQIINENIDRFGGDPNRVLVKGSGAGSAMTGMLMLTDQCTRSFQSVMIQSGTFLSSKYIQINPKENAKALIEELGLDYTNSDSLVEELKCIDAFDIVEAQEAISLRNPQRGFLNYKPFLPTVELPYENAIVTSRPVDLMKEGNICDIPVCIGFNNKEGLELFPMLKEEPELIDKFNEDNELLIPEGLKYPDGSEARKNCATRIRDFYFNGENISYVNMQNYVNLVSDTQYIFSVDLFVKLFKEKMSSPVYSFEFNCNSELNWYKMLNNITFCGASHYDELGYGFLPSLMKSKYQHLGSTTKKMLDEALLLVKWLLYGASLSDKGWPEDGQNRSYYSINDRESYPVYNRPARKRMEFWDSEYEIYLNSEYSAASYFCSNEDIETTTTSSV